MDYKEDKEVKMSDDYQDITNLVNSLPKNCKVSSSNEPVVDDFLCFNIAPWICDSPLMVFERGVDFEILTNEPMSFDGEVEEKTSNLALKQAEVTKISQTGSLEITAQYGSKLLQFISNFIAEEGTTGRDGDGVLDLMNGGLFYLRRITYNKGTLKEYQKLHWYPNLLMTKMPTPFLGDLTSEAVYALEFQVVSFPKTLLNGQVDDEYGIPEGISAPVLKVTKKDYSSTTQKITIEFELVEDPDEIIDFLVIRTEDEAYNILEEKEIVAVIGTVQTNLLIGNADTNRVSIGYKISEESESFERYNKKVGAVIPGEIPTTNPII